MWLTAWERKIIGPVIIIIYCWVVSWIPAAHSNMLADKVYVWYAWKGDPCWEGEDDQCGVLSTGVQLYIEDVGECGTHSKSVQFGSMTTSTRYFLTQEQGWRRNLVRVYIGRYSYTGLGPLWMRSKSEHNCGGDRVNRDGNIATSFFSKLYAVYGGGSAALIPTKMTDCYQSYPIPSPLVPCTYSLRLV